jgi:ribosomal protein L11 methyltransferase
VFANILLAPLRLLASPMARLIAPQARVILSGLLATQANAALGAYRSNDFALERRIVLDGWATLVLRRAGG